MELSRIFVDAAGVEWEVFDESMWTVSMALDWDYLPQLDNPGLIFSSNRDRRRLWPCPADWKRSSDAELQGFLERSVSML